MIGSTSAGWNIGLFLSLRGVSQLLERSCGVDAGVVDPYGLGLIFGIAYSMLDPDSPIDPNTVDARA
jgi:hypothetical protein